MTNIFFSVSVRLSDLLSFCALSSSEQSVRSLVICFPSPPYSLSRLVIQTITCFPLVSRIRIHVVVFLTSLFVPYLEDAV